jgi:hypothetical protein
VTSCHILNSPDGNECKANKGSKENPCCSNTNWARKTSALAINKFFITGGIDCLNPNCIIPVYFKYKISVIVLAFFFITISLMAVPKSSKSF